MEQDTTFLASERWVIEQDDYKQTLYHRSARHDSMETLQNLLDLSTNPQVLCEILQIQDIEGKTALHYAASNSAPRITTILDSIKECDPKDIANLINIESKHGETVIHLAAHNAYTLYMYSLKCEFEHAGSMEFVNCPSCRLFHSTYISPIYPVVYRECNFLGWESVQDCLKYSSQISIYQPDLKAQSL